METAKLFQNGQSQAVRLPKAYRFQGECAFIKRVGAGVLLLLYTESWDTLLASLNEFSDDFLVDRDQPPQQPAAH